SYKGSSQTLVGLKVQDSNASPNDGLLMDAAPDSTNLGNNTNWDFQPSDIGFRYWIATSTGNWNDANNWSLSSGGPLTGGVPVATHTVVFDGANSSSGDCIINSTVTV